MQKGDSKRFPHVGMSEDVHREVHDLGYFLGRHQIRVFGQHDITAFLPGGGVHRLHLVCQDVFHEIGHPLGELQVPRASALATPALKGFWADTPALGQLVLIDCDFFHHVSPVVVGKRIQALFGHKAKSWEVGGVASGVPVPSI